MITNDHVHAAAIQYACYHDMIVSKIPAKTFEGPQRQNTFVFQALGRENLGLRVDLSKVS